MGVRGVYCPTQYPLMLTSSENPIWQLVRLFSEPRQILTAPGQKAQLDRHAFKLQLDTHLQ
jgi:hypothetical protein